MSPVFELAPLTLKQLAAIERRILDNPVLMQALRHQMRQDNAPQDAEFLLRNFYLPMEVQGDFADIYSTALGAAYHHHRGIPFRMGGTMLLDRGNVAVVAPDRLSFNGLLFQLSTRQVERLVHNQRQPTPQMRRELYHLQTWLRQFPEAAQVQVFPPLEVYVRHWVTITEVLQPLDVGQIMVGGVPPEEAIGEFRYAFDARGGIPGWAHPLPPTVTFRYGVGSSLTRISNLAVRFPGLAATVGRIEERKVCTGAYLGRMAAQCVPKNPSTKSLGSSLGRNHPEFHGGKHFRVQADLGFVGAQFANIRDANLPAIHRLPRPGLDHFRHVFFCDAPEQAVIFSGGHSNGELPNHFQSSFAGESIFLFPDFPLALLLLAAFHLAQYIGGGGHRFPLGNQIIAGITGSYFYHLPGGSQLHHRSR